MVHRFLSSKPGRISIYLFDLDSSGQYSLTGDPGESQKYRIGVLLHPESRGGSSTLHKQIQTGQHLKISRPRQNFPLVMNANHILLLAGGIGITPILSMVKVLDRLNRSFEIHYCGRTQERMAFPT